MLYNIPPAKRGDTWNGIESVVVKISGKPINFAERKVKMEFRDDVDAPVSLTLSTENSGIVIMPGASSVRIMPFEINIPSGNYHYDFQVISPSGYTKTYITGNWVILPDITF